jgi:PAS domain S-box-containing protein
MRDDGEFRHMGGGRKGLFLVLRYVFIVAASYLVLFQNEDFKPTYGLMIAAALASNVALSMVSQALVFSWYVEAPILIADTLWVSWALHSAGAAGQEFFLLYFFVLSLAALGESLFLVLFGSTSLSAINVYLGGWHPDNLIQIVFFYTVALFYGYVINEIKAERQRADRGVRWVKELERMVSERTRELSRLYDALSESESRYRAVSELTSDYAFSLRIDPASGPTIEWVTDSVARITGYTQEELSADAWAQIIHPDDVEGLKINKEPILAGEPLTTEFRIVTKSGEVRRLRTLIRPGETVDGVTHLYGAAQDITARWRAEESRQRLLEVLEATPDMVAISDPSGKALYYNAASRKALGLTPEDDISRLEISGHLPAWARDVMRNEAIPTAVCEGSWNGESAFLSGGRELPVSQVVVAHKGADGEIVAFSTVARDFTERKRLEDNLQQEARISNAMARVGRELISVLDTNVLVDRLCHLTLELLDCDASATMLLKTEEPGVVPVAFAARNGAPQAESIRHVDLSRGAGDELLDALEGEEVVSVDHAMGARALSAAQVEAGGSEGTLYMALRRGEKLIGYHTATYIDGSSAFSPERKRIARGIAHLASLALENAQLTASLERANRLKSEFVATMSHELRTPLNIMLGFTDLLRDGEYGPTTTEQCTILDRVEQSGWQLLELINATLDLSRLEQGKLELEYRETRVASLLRELRNETEPLLTGKPDVKLVWRTPADLPSIHTDPLKLKVVLKNLITNAVKFTEQGQVTVETLADNGSIRFGVTDTGVGIPEHALPAIFEPFRQVDGSSTRRHEGVGLGLHIVRRYLDLLGGEIHVESVEGRGSKFLVSIPRSRMSLQAPADMLARIQKADSEQTH